MKENMGFFSWLQEAWVYSSRSRLNGERHAAPVHTEPSGRKSLSAVEVRRSDSFKGVMAHLKKQGAAGRSIAGR